MRRLFTCSILILLIVVAVHAVPSSITYQGKLLDNGTPVNGNYTLSFAIFETETGGNPIWPASGYETHNVLVENGLFTVILGNGTPQNPIQPAIFNNLNAWLEIKTQTASFPRIQMHNVPYSLQAENLSIKGNNIGDLLMWDGNNWIPTSFKIYYRDFDGDGYGDQNFTIYTNNPLPGYIETSGDCDDKNISINPNQPEIIGDGIDNNCNGIIDESN